MLTASEEQAARAILFWCELSRLWNSRLTGSGFGLLSIRFLTIKPMTAITLQTVVVLLYDLSLHNLECFFAWERKLGIGASCDCWDAGALVCCGRRHWGLGLQGVARAIKGPKDLPQSGIQGFACRALEDACLRHRS